MTRRPVTCHECNGTGWSDGAPCTTCSGQQVLRFDAPPQSDGKAKWLEYHRAHPEVWTLFERFTMEAIQKGHTRLSPWLIINRIRWETDVVTRRGEPFKIANGHIAYYSRHFMAVHPRYKGFFRTRETAEEKTA